MDCFETEYIWSVQLHILHTIVESFHNIQRRKIKEEILILTSSGFDPIAFKDPCILLSTNTLKSNKMRSKEGTVKLQKGKCTLAFHMRNQTLQIANTSKNTHYCCTIFFFNDQVTRLGRHLFGNQCFPYQAVTSKNYRWKQHFLLPATALRFNKIKEVLSTHQVAINLAAMAPKILKLATWFGKKSS